MVTGEWVVGVGSTGGVGVGFVGRDDVMNSVWMEVQFACVCMSAWTQPPGNEHFFDPGFSSTLPVIVISSQ